MKKMITGFAMIIVVVSVATMCNSNRDLEQTKAINDKKDYCLKHQLDKDLNDDCKAIIRDLKIRGEEYGF